MGSAVVAGVIMCRRFAASTVYDEEDVTFVEDIASRVSMTLQNADLYRQVQDGERRFRLLAENATDVVWCLNEDAVMVWASPSQESVLGWGPEELLGTQPRDLVHPADQKTVDDRRQQWLSGSETRYEVRIRTADTSYR